MFSPRTLVSTRVWKERIYQIFRHDYAFRIKLDNSETTKASCILTLTAQDLTRVIRLGSQRAQNECESKYQTCNNLRATHNSVLTLSSR